MPVDFVKVLVLVVGVGDVADAVKIAMWMVLTAVTGTRVELQENADEGLAVEPEMDDYQKSPKPKQEITG